MKQRKSETDRFKMTLDQTANAGLKYRLVLYDSGKCKDILLWRFEKLVRANKAFDKLKNLIQELYEV